MTTVRAAAHVHSEWSDDATWKLADIAAGFAERGYDVVLLADHCREFVASRWAEYRAACAEASTGAILLVPGIEYNDLDNAVHVPVWGDVPFYGQQVPDIGALLTGVTADGGTSVLAHPWRRDAWRRYQPAWSAHLAAVEVWNRKYDGIAPNRQAAELARREGLPQFAAVDFHTSRQFFPLAMRLRLAGDTVDLPAVHSALREGAFEAAFRERPVESMLRGPALHAAVAAETARRAVRPAVNRLRRLRG